MLVPLQNLVLWRHCPHLFTFLYYIRSQDTSSSIAVGLQARFLGSLWNASCCVIILINFHVPSNGTQTMYNILFVLLKSQHVLTILSGHHQVNTSLTSALLNCKHFTSHMGPYLQWFLFDDSIGISKIYI
jgi:hypothetical protein